MESVNPENLAASRKHQNHVGEYRTMLQAWRSGGVLTQAGYILGFPADTPESIERDIKIIQRELPVDILEFFMMTPLPGSADHRDLYLQGKWLEPDLNRYDGEHAAAEHPRMSAEEWRAIYDRAWHLYYSPEHVATLLRRPRAGGTRTTRLAGAIFTFYASHRFEGVHPLQAGAFRLKVRRTRRPGMPKENPVRFYLKRLWEMFSTYASAGIYYLWLDRLRKRIQRAPDASTYTDAALTGSVGHTVNGDRSRAKTMTSNSDPLKPNDPAWLLDFKKKRAQQNEQALEVLNRKAVRAG